MVYMLCNQRVSRSHVCAAGDLVRHGCCVLASSHACAQTRAPLGIAGPRMEKPLSWTCQVSGLL